MRLFSKNIVNTVNMSIRHVLPQMAFAVASLSLLPFSARAADPIDELKDGVKSFKEHSSALMRLDREQNERMWEVYCGEFDPFIKEDREFAADIGKQLQNKEIPIREALITGEFEHWRTLADRITTSSAAAAKDKDEARGLRSVLISEREKLERLDQGVVLRGSNHPFIQYAIQYGVDQHKDMEGRYGDSKTRVKDENWPGISGRPDLVAMEGGHLVVYEFKPNNSAAKSKGERQVRGYLDAVEAYYQKLFPKGRTGGYNDPPDDKHGGKAMLDALSKSPETWSSDGKSLHSIPIVETYNMCDRKF